MKKQMIPAAVFAALCSTIMYGCIEDTGDTNATRGTAVMFPTTIPKTRAYDNKWEHNDHIGVYMLPAGSTDWNAPATAPLSSNYKYGLDIANGEPARADVLFSGVDESNVLVWPGGNRRVDFVAYYPWHPALVPDDYIYRIDISGQTPQKDIDLMWSDNLKGKSSGSPELRFSHRLSKLIFNVTDLDGASLEGMNAIFDGLPTVAGFDLATGAIVHGTGSGVIDPHTFEGHPASTGSAEEAAGEAIVEAIVLPGSDLDYTVTFVLGGGENAIFNVPVTDYEPGRRYIYNVRLQPRPGGDASFGADGELESIHNWETPDEDGSDHDIDITGPGGGSGSGSSGAKWESGKIVSDPDSSGYTIVVTPLDTVTSDDGDGYRVPAPGVTTIKKGNYEGDISSVTLSLRTSGFGEAGRISSVKVGTTDLVTGDGGTPNAKSVEFNKLSATTTYTFTPANGNPVGGDVTIVIESLAQSVIITGFGINAANP